MKLTFGDIWNTKYDDHWRVIPTNLGWDRKGHNIMGAGLAKQAADRYPVLPKEYGKVCQEMRDNPVLYIAEEQKLILLGTKPLRRQAPHLSWMNKADLGLIERMLGLLVHWAGEYDYPKIIVPLLGAGLGKIYLSDLLPVMEKYLLRYENFTLIYADDKGVER